MSASDEEESMDLTGDRDKRNGNNLSLVTACHWVSGQ